jgi:RNA polymerase sigma-70 factor (ECF subfamily)
MARRDHHTPAVAIALGARPERSLASVAVARPPELRVDATDAELVTAVRRGERIAEERLYRRHVQAVAGVAVRLLGRSAEAEDVVQDSFVSAFERLSQLRDADAFRPWLLRIAVHHVHRRFRRRKLLALLGLDRGQDDAGLAQLAAPGMDHEGRVELGRIDAALRTLGAAERVAWMLRHVEGYGLGQIAIASGVSLATVKRRLQRAETCVAAYSRGGSA